MNKPTNPSDLLKHGTSESFSPTDNKVTALRSVTGHKIDISWAVNLEPPKSSEYLIKGVIEPSQVSIWAGAPGSGKTFLMLYMAHAIATGREVFGRGVRQAKTLYMALEGRGGINKRVYALCRDTGDAPLFGVSGTSLDLLVSDRSGTRINTEVVESLIRTIRENELKLLIIDTLNLTLGGADENDNSMMGQLLKAAGDIATATQCHIAFVAHTGHKAETGVRGASSQRGNGDQIVIISGDKTLKASSHPPGKVKDGAPFELFFELKGENLATDDDGDAITSCTIVPVDKPEGGEGRKLSKSHQGWFTDLSDMFLETGNDAPVRRQSSLGITALTLTREQVRAGFRKRGRFGNVTENGVLDGATRKQLSTALNALKDANKIGMDAELVWLVT